MHQRIIRPIAFYSLLALSLSGCGGGSSSSGSDSPAPVTPSNNAPIAQDDTASVEDSSTELTVDVLANDSDADGDQLSISEVSDSTQGVTPSIVDGSIVYTLPTGFTGEDTFTYTVSDGADTATATVTVTITAANSIPNVVDDSVSVLNLASDLTIDVLANDTDDDEDALQITAVGVSEQGVTPQIENQQIRYTLPSNFTGSDSFEYTVSDGTDEAKATVSVSIIPGLTISGSVQGAADAEQEVVVHIGSESYPAATDQATFSVDVPTPAESDVISITATIQQDSSDQPLVLKSYAGWGTQIVDAVMDGAVSESELPTLYLSAASTSAAAMMERAAGEAITTQAQLVEFSQVLAQDLLLESAITMVSLLEGDAWPEFTHADSYALLMDFPTAVQIAETLKASNRDKYNSYFSSIVDDTRQASPLAIAPAQELLFIEGPSSIRRPYGFAVQIAEESGNNAYLAEFGSLKNDDNQITYSIDDRTITLDVASLSPAYTSDEASVNCPAVANPVAYSIATKRELTKYLDTPAFSAFSMVETHKCVESAQTFTVPNRFYQINTHYSGDFSPLVTGTFATSSYRDLDENTFLKTSRWQAAINTANGSGNFTQRFDFKNSVTDTAELEILENGRLSMTTGRGDSMEYIPLGMDGAAIRTLAILRRDDNSIASFGGDLLVPVKQPAQLPLPAQLNYGDSIFSIVDPTSDYHDLGFAFDFLLDGTGTDKERFATEYASNGNVFSWFNQGTYVEMRYYYDRNTKTFRTDCTGVSSTCDLNRFREFELLNVENGNYYIRVFNETDRTSITGTSFNPYIFQYSYIDRFTLGQ
uniref:Ig-like domain-containing protein n=1 Tax=Microbulbifer agarilyticus TaxID=260552 RepID=UPI00030AF557|nr:Ig-like domain-containing protein [Microbulbifer agarilyticus]